MIKTKTDQPLLERIGSLEYFETPADLQLCITGEDFVMKDPESDIHLKLTEVNFNWETNRDQPEHKSFICDLYFHDYSSHTLYCALYNLDENKVGQLFRYDQVQDISKSKVNKIKGMIKKGVANNINDNMIKNMEYDALYRFG